MPEPKPDEETTPMHSHTIRTTDGVSLDVVSAGSGPALLFLHEFCTDRRTWDRQLSVFAASHRCVAFSARGYGDSEVPADDTAYSWTRAVQDAVDVLDALEIENAHVVGLSMGGYTALQLALNHPDRVRSVVSISAGSGSEPSIRDAYLAETEVMAEELLTRGSRAVGERMAVGPSRVQLMRSNPAAWRQLTDHFGEQSALGLARTIVNVQGRRPSLFAMEQDLAGAAFPLLVVVGDEDEACLPAGLLLKRTVPGCGLEVLPMTGHSPNLEDPDRFDALLRRFLVAVEGGRWPTRDPRSKATLQFSRDADNSLDDRT